MKLCGDTFTYLEIIVMPLPVFLVLRYKLLLYVDHGGHARGLLKVAFHSLKPTHNWCALSYYRCDE